MIFGNESISTYTRENMSIWMVLAFQAGLLNIGGFLAVQTFVSHVTGFATLFGVELGQGEYLHAFSLLLAPMAFFVGAMVSGILIDLRLKMKKKPRYYVVFGVLFLLLMFVDIAGFNGFFGEFGKTVNVSRDYTLLMFLCLICGLQNGTITLVSKSVVRTTHLTGVLTDLGIGIVRILNRRKLQGQLDNEGQANLMRIGIISFFVLGSAVGVIVFTKMGFRGFILPTLISGILFGLTFYFQVFRPWRQKS